MATPTYLPLSCESRETRFIKIEPKRNQNDIVSCTLHMGSLNGCEPYYALSYVWGSPADTSQIVLNGSVHLGTINLEAALRQLRLSGYTNTPIWIDAVCINQVDIIERNQQVSMMCRIYENAKLVIGWLGPCTDTSDLGMDAISLWKQQHQILESRGDQDISDILTQTSESTRLLSTETTESIQELFERAWWFRQWISQEIILAKDILIFCGEKTIPWADVCDAYEVWSTLIQPDYAGFLETWQQLWLSVMVSKVFELFERIRTRRAAGDTIPMSTLLPMFRGLAVSDPRDKVFALLGLASDGSTFSPDYRLSINTIYIRYMMTELQASSDLNILQHCFFNASSAQHGIPSWVPDWSNNDIPFSIDRALYNCGETGNDTYSVSNDLKRLRIQGMVVTKVARSVPAKSLLPPLDPEEEVESSVWKSLIVDQNRALYASGEWWGVRLFRTSFLDVDPTTSERFDIDSTSFFGLLFAYCWWLRHYHSVPDNVILSIWFGQKDSLENRNKLNNMTETWLKAFEPHILRGFNTQKRRLFVTEDGNLGMGPPSIKEGDEGDLVCVLLGCRVPFILRKFGQGYRIVGECFMLGIMDGEAIERMENGELILDTFDIF